MAEPGALEVVANWANIIVGAAAIFFAVTALIQREEMAKISTKQAVFQQKYLFVFSIVELSEDIRLRYEQLLIPQATRNDFEQLYSDWDAKCRHIQRNLNLLQKMFPDDCDRAQDLWQEVRQIEDIPSHGTTLTGQEADRRRANYSATHDRFIEYLRSLID